MQWSQKVAEEESEVWLTGHCSQAVSPYRAENVPAAQPTQNVEADPEEYQPGLQLRHAVELCEGWYDPERHVLQEVALIFAEKAPGGQS